MSWEGLKKQWIIKRIYDKDMVDWAREMKIIYSKKIQMENL